VFSKVLPIFIRSIGEVEAEGVPYVSACARIFEI
jgi:hypothetical protein